MVFRGGSPESMWDSFLAYTGIEVSKETYHKLVEENFDVQEVFKEVINVHGNIYIESAIYSPGNKFREFTLQVPISELSRIKYTRQIIGQNKNQDFESIYKHLYIIDISQLISTDQSADFHELLDPNLWPMHSIPRRESIGEYAFWDLEMSLQRLQNILEYYSAVNFLVDDLKRTIQVIPRAGNNALKLFTQGLRYYENSHYTAAFQCFLNSSLSLNRQNIPVWFDEYAERLLLQPDAKRRAIPNNVSNYHMESSVPVVNIKLRFDVLKTNFLRLSLPGDKLTGEPLILHSLNEGSYRAQVQISKQGESVLHIDDYAYFGENVFILSQLDSQGWAVPIAIYQVSGELPIKNKVAQNFELTRGGYYMDKNGYHTKIERISKSASDYNFYMAYYVYDAGDSFIEFSSNTSKSLFMNVNFDLVQPDDLDIIVISSETVLNIDTDKKYSGDELINLLGSDPYCFQTIKIAKEVSNDEIIGMALNLP
jgi:hypothetical protein